MPIWTEEFMQDRAHVAGLIERIASTLGVPVSTFYDQGRGSEAHHAAIHGALLRFIVQSRGLESVLTREQGLDLIEALRGYIDRLPIDSA